MKGSRRVLVLGLDGLEPGLVEPMLAAGELPAIGRLRSLGGLSRVATTYPAQTPVAWSTFATGTNPGGHGIFDFLRRDPATGLPDLALNRYEQKNAFVPPRAVNLRTGTPFWELLGAAGIPSTVIRCPCTYPAEKVHGRLLAGMGVPDLRGGLGTPTWLTEDPAAAAGESERVARLARQGAGYSAVLPGPKLPGGGEATVELAIEPGTAAVTVRAGKEAVRVPAGGWSDWLRVRFKLGLLQSVAGMVRFHLPRAGAPFALYASPVNFAPDAPPFPISAPWDYAGELEDRIGSFHTTGMVEEHTGLLNGRLDEAAFLAHCEVALREREAMLQLELGRFREGFLFCLFDTPDRLQHMFWRFREPGHPANAHGNPAEYHRAIEDHYRQCDAIVGRALEQVDPDTLVIVLSDHGFTSFQRGVNLNRWLHQAGLLRLNAGVDPDAAGDFFREVDWSRTRAYALGLGGIYLNLAGREARGIVPPAEGPALAQQIQEGLGGLPDPARGMVAVREVRTRESLYRGPAAAEAPDLLVLCNRGYRASWATALGGVGAGVLEDNTRRWGGDHIVDPALVPGMLCLNRPFRTAAPRLEDLAPTILGAFGLPAGPAMEGSDLLA